MSESIPLPESPFKQLVSSGSINELKVKRVPPPEGRPSPFYYCLLGEIKGKNSANIVLISARGQERIWAKIDSLADYIQETLGGCGFSVDLN